MHSHSVFMTACDISMHIQCHHSQLHTRPSVTATTQTGFPLVVRDTMETERERGVGDREETEKDSERGQERGRADGR